MLRGDPTRDGLIGRGLLATLCVLALATAGGRAHADALDGALAVRSAYVNIDHGVFLLHARVEYPQGPAIRNALREGITLDFDLEVRIERERHLWFNANIVELTLPDGAVVEYGPHSLGNAYHTPVPTRPPDGL